MEWLIGVFGIYCALAIVVPRVRLDRFSNVFSLSGRRAALDYSCAFLVCVAAIASSRELIGPVSHGLINVVLVLFAVLYTRFWPH